MSGEGISGGEDRRTAGRTVDAVSVTIGERFGSVVVKSEVVNCGFPMTGDARLSIRHHNRYRTWIVGTDNGFSPDPVILYLILSFPTGALPIDQLSST